VWLKLQSVKQGERFKAIRLIQLLVVDLSMLRKQVLIFIENQAYLFISK
jgi:hypothetical protein